MKYFLIVLSVATLTSQNIFRKQYNLKHNSGGILFSGIVSLFALLFFAVTTKNVPFEIQILPYSLAFAACYGLTIISNYFAIIYGSLAVTTLILSYSLVIPALYGFAFLGEKAGVSQVFGIILLVVSLFLVNYQKKTKEFKLSVKWIVHVSISFLTNGFCSIIQKQQQNRFNGAYNGSFMIIALFAVTVALLTIGIIFERESIKDAFKSGVVYGGLCGICNGANNYLVMLSLSVMATSVFFPILTAGQLILTFMISAVFYREKFGPNKLVGLFCGIAALILLNL